MRRLAFILVLILSPLPLPLLAQPPAETCGAGDSLDQSDMLPISITATAASDDLDMTGTGCSESGLDHVTCFVPTDNCTVDVACTDAAGLELGVLFTVNVTEGPCSTAPASCIASDSAFGDVSVSGVALTGGTRYCFVCEVDFSNPQTLEVTATSGDCGALPVGLQSFEID